MVSHHQNIEMKHHQDVDVFMTATIEKYNIPVSETPEGKERLRAYYEALGRFVDIFARVETAVTLTLWRYAKTSPEIAKIIFAGAKIELGSTYIKQLAEATGASQEARDGLTNVLQQLGIINGVRNAVLHYAEGCDAAGGALANTGAQSGRCGRSSQGRARCNDDL
jgi:hypothetical protein